MVICEMFVDVIQTGDMAQSVLLCGDVIQTGDMAQSVLLWGNACIAPLLLHLDTRWRWEVNFMSWLLYPLRKGPWNPQARWS